MRLWPAYPAYKDSGVPWLGEIPEDWNAIKIKWLAKVRRGASPRPIDDPIYFDDDGEYAWVRISDVTASSKYLLETEQTLSELGKSKSVPLEPGEIFLSIAATVGKPIITRIKCCIHDGFVYFVGLQQNREYLFYLFSGGELYKGLGKHGTQLNLNTETIGDIEIPLPPLPEQRAIAAFLDRETAKLDALTRKFEHLIEVAQEQRAALISHAVTRGLDPDVPLKDSRIPWLGEIPAHWNLARAKQVSSIFIPQRNKPELNSDTGYAWITMEDIARPVIQRSIATRFVTEKAALSAGSRVLPQGSVIASCVGNFGVAAVNVDPVIINQQLQAYMPRRMYAWFFRYLIEVSKPYFDMIANATTLSYVNRENFGELPVLLPSEDEQHAIAAYLDRETAKLDALVTKAQEAIARLAEYRTALISAAVTGKIDVREA